MTVPRDDRAWPRGAGTFSLLLGLLAAAAGVAITVNALDRGPGLAAVVGGVFAAVLAVEVYAYLTGIRSWLAGDALSPTLAFGQLLAMAAGFVVLLLDPAVGGAVLAGLFAGVLLGNVVAIRLARRNRGRVDEAEAAQAAVRAAAPAAPRPAVASPADVEPVGRLLRDTVSTEARRTAAWLVAGGLAFVAWPVLGLPPGVAFAVLALAVAVLLWVLRRLWGARLALADFDRADTPPARAYVVLLRDPAPRMIRPLLGIWSRPPEVSGGRLSRPERVYRCDEEHDRLECIQGSVEVHEAWVDTGPRPRSKPRWVAADAGVVLPHRRAVLGRWYLSSL
ncbi:MAG TPA: hypothetical protein VE547_08675, partial [Mycobacteriales bacterium]|nr:hypothetical protein [Mycobacteriales bacterium]